MVFPEADRDPGPRMRRKAAALLLVLIEASGRLAMTARSADPEAYATWKAHRMERYDERGPDRAAATQTRMELIETAWPQ